MQRVNIYIDGNNLHRGAKRFGFRIDYKKFNGWLRQKYNLSTAHLFIGYLPDRKDFYAYLRECGFNLIFKHTIIAHRIVKGNCDAELVLKVISDFYTKAFEYCLIITGDGDFGCVIEFLRDNHVLNGVIAPNSNGCSLLIKNKNVNITFLDNHYHKFKI